MSEPVIEISGVTKAFDEREVLKGIDLEIAEHQAVALIGASGSGKSTLLRCIDLLIDVDDGDIFLDGEVITDPSVDPVDVRRRLGFVFQAYNLFPHLNVLDNVTLGLKRAGGMTAADAEDSARRMLARFGLEGRENESPPTSPAASSSGSRSPAPSRPGRERCCSTRSRARSTPSWSARSSGRCATSRTKG